MLEEFVGKNTVFYLAVAANVLFAAVTYKRDRAVALVLILTWGLAVVFRAADMTLVSNVFSTVGLLATVCGCLRARRKLHGMQGRP